MIRVMRPTLTSTLQALWQKNDLVTRANALAFGLLISFIPMMVLIILALSALVPYVTSYFSFKNLDFINLMQVQLSGFLPIAKKDMTTILDFLQNNWGNFSQRKILSFGFLLCILYASQAMWLILRSFEMQQLTNVRDTRPYIFRRILSLYFTLFVLLLGVGVIITLLGINILLPKAAILAGIATPKIVLIKYAKWFIAVLLLYFGLCVIYKFGNIEKIPFFSFGAGIATIAIILISIALSPILRKYSTYHLVYGPLSAILLMAIWFQISSFAIFLGQDLNIARKIMQQSQFD